VSVPSEDVRALAEALERVLTDDAFAASCSKAALELASELHWSSVLEPLVSYCRTATRSPDAFTDQPVEKVPARVGLVERAVRGVSRALQLAKTPGGAEKLARRTVNAGRRGVSRRP
jgi:hypothetical protein